MHPPYHHNSRQVLSEHIFIAEEMVRCQNCTADKVTALLTSLVGATQVPGRPNLVIKFSVVTPKFIQIVLKV